MEHQGDDIFFTTNIASLSFGEDGIFRYRYTVKGATEDEQEARVTTDAIDEYFRGQKVPMLIDASNLGSISRKARAVRAGSGILDHASKMAVIAPTPVAMLISKVYLFLVQPKVNIRIFGNEDEATEWLRAQPRIAPQP